MTWHLPSPPGDIQSVDANEFRQAMRNLASGVAIVASGTGPDRRGLTVSSITSLCLEPPCLLVCIGTTSETYTAILANGGFGVSLLASDQQDVALRFAGRVGAKGVHRFEEAPWDEGLLGIPVLSSAICVLECVLHHHQMVGTHGIFVGRIVAARTRQGQPLVNFRGALRTLTEG
ncbi:flavin reductase family protein [Bradyrhizobium yuanmingense]|uniref:flavin reductase family protein n=1 Tax=Bradyrhizobium yuanmingense TaxID=108015 RepID=UPI0030844BCA